MKKNSKILIGVALLLTFVLVVIFTKGVGNNGNGDPFNTLECAPAPGCHPTSCVDKSTISDELQDVFCTEECVQGTLDCGQGFCQDVNGKCEAVFN